MLGPGIPSLSLEKARLVVVVGNPDTKELKFQYNPAEFTFTKNAKWIDATAQGARTDVKPPPTYHYTEPSTLSMDVFFDRFSQFGGDVTKDVQTLLDWTKPCLPKRNGLMQPPMLELQWGDSKALRGFQGYLSNVTANFTHFRMNGAPVRASCKITLTEIPVFIGRTNPTSGSLAAVRSHVLIEGETLQAIAWEEYGSATHWRALAEYNGIDDPLRLEAGTRLLIPEQRDAAKLV